MQKEKKDTRCGYYLRVLKFLCKRQNTLIKQNSHNLECLSVKVTSKTWNTLLSEINTYRGDNLMKAASLERSLRELKRRGYIEPIKENSSRYIVSEKGFEVVGIKEKKAELKEKIALPSKDKTHINIRCRSCNVIDGYLLEDDTCRYCSAKLYPIDRI